MNERGDPAGPDSGSGLDTWRRLRLYARNPRDAFSITSVDERRRDAALALALYFVVRTPVLLQRNAALKRAETLDAVQYAAGLALGLLCGVLATLVLLAIGAALLHLVLDVAVEARGASRDETRRLLALCLAPQLVLVLEFPSLLLDFRGYGTFLSFLLLRLLADVLSARTFYWGLRTLFAVRPGPALALTVGPTAALLAVFAPVILSGLR